MAEAARSECREGEEEGHADGDHEHEPPQSRRSAAPAPDPDQTERDEHRRPDLGGDRRAEQRSSGPFATREQRTQTADREGRDPEIEAREDHVAEQERRDRHEPERACEAHRLRAQRRERDGGEQDDDDARSRHPSVEVMRVGVEVVRICGRVGRERRHKEAGRVLDREVPVRDPPVDGLLRVRLVHGRVHALDARPVPEVVDERPGAEEDGDTAGRDRDARASAHANDFRRTLRKHEHARSEQRCADEDGAL